MEFHTIPAGKTQAKQGARKRARRSSVILRATLQHSTTATTCSTNGTSLSMNTLEPPMAKAPATRATSGVPP